MQGYELCRGYFQEYGLPMLNSFPALAPLVCAALCGSGSECYGYDDLFSTDHDFEPGFCLFLPPEEIVSRRDAFLLERAYARLPAEYMGIQRSRLSPAGGARHGVIRMADFFRDKVGMEGDTLTDEAWLRLPQWSLAEATNGYVFYDPSGVFTSRREYLLHMPADHRNKRIASHLLLMAQSGQYNFARCAQRGERAAAQLAVNSFVGSTLEVCFLLSEKYMPYYKWSFRALRDLPGYSCLAEPLEELLCTSGTKSIR